MKTIKLLQKTTLIVLLSFALVSCLTTNVNTSMKDIRLGMSKREVIDKLGDGFKVVSMTQTNRGYLEELSFTDWEIKDNGTSRSYVAKGYYILHFLDGKLTESHYEDANKRPSRPNRPGRPR